MVRLSRSGETRRLSRHPSPKVRLGAIEVRMGKVEGTLGAVDHRNVRAERWKAALTASHGLRSWPGLGLACQGELILLREGSPPQIAVVDFFQSKAVSASRHEGVRLDDESG